MWIYIIIRYKPWKLAMVMINKDEKFFKLLVFIILFPYIFLLNVSNKLAILGQGYQI